MAFAERIRESAIFVQRNDSRMLRLTDNRPLIFFDLETTGANLMVDRIVEISVVKIMPDGSREVKTRLLNPEMHIPEEATAIHHITDDDVRDMPPFRRIARNLAIYFEECDLAGYNINKFDIPMLAKEFARCNVPFSLKGRRIIDVYTIFCRMEPRNLTAAYKFFCGKKLDGAHGAEADALATLEVFEAQIERYSSMPAEEFPEPIGAFPQTMDEFHSFCNQTNPECIDRNGRFKWRAGEAVCSFGRHNGVPLKRIAADFPDFLRWILKADFDDDVKTIASNALQGRFPERKEANAS